MDGAEVDVGGCDVELALIVVALCDRVTPQTPDTNSIAIEGAANIRAAIVPIELIYATASQLG